MAIFLKANWENIVMANYEIDPKILQPYLPKGVELDLFEGKAYVSLVGFMFKNTRLFNIPIPYLGTFEEINLRFYVLRKEAGHTKRGVVFINETIPYRVVAWVANKLYKEHYTTIPTKHDIKIGEHSKEIRYEWLQKGKWNSIQLSATTDNKAMQEGSFAQFIFEHYYGYTKIDAQTTEEYRLHHPSWRVNTITQSAIDCDFKAMYGDDFEVLNRTEPTDIFIAEGSAVSVEWKRNRLDFLVV
jgi:uncharacterized protein YqjF (DUF2071 family)